jgi:V/A-type H+-transporting ATPase subunit C
MLSRALLLDMVNADNFQQAAELLNTTEYTLPQGGKDFSEMETTLISRRSDIRKLFQQLILDKPLMEILEARDDFANMRLALRRKLTDRPIDGDYSNEGFIPSDQFRQIFEEENYEPLPLYIRQAVEDAVLAYYQAKDVRQIDYAIDNAQILYKLEMSFKLNNIFLQGLFRTQVDLTNIRTMFRLKFNESKDRNVFLAGGYVETEKFRTGLDLAYDAIAALFFATPYYEIISSSIGYIEANKSFLRLEHLCEKHLLGYLKSTSQITAGPQPIIAYLMMKEAEIRMVRLILTAKNNGLDKRLILDRLGE